MNLKANFETGFSLHRGSRIETRRFQTLGQLKFNLYSPTQQEGVLVLGVGPDAVEDDGQEARLVPRGDAPEA